MIDIAADDDGGELDVRIPAQGFFTRTLIDRYSQSAGADNRGNPLGSLMFTNAFGGNSSVNGTGYSQALRWHNFMGANQFCLKAVRTSCDLSWVCPG